MLPARLDDDRNPAWMTCRLADSEAVLGEVFLLTGIIAVLMVLVDAFWTTLWVDGGAGPITDRVTSWSWRGVIKVVGRENHFLLSLFGPSILIVGIAMWAGLLWTGWVLIFSADPGAIVNAADGTPADASDRIWFVGYMLSTVGNGDFTPRGGGWQAASAIAGFTGFLVVTLVVSYVLSVLGAVVDKRAFASRVTGMGLTPPEFVEHAWDGLSFRSLDPVLDSLAGSLGKLSEQSLSYPILQYYHAATRRKSPAYAVAVFDEALALICSGTPPDVQPGRAPLHSVRAAVRSYLDALPAGFVRPADDEPPAPDLSALRRAGVPVAAEGTLVPDDDSQRLRRRILLGMVRSDGWRWFTEVH